jgi:DNA-binding beta-propeller fold protein YncE
MIALYCPCSAVRFYGARGIYSHMYSGRLSLLLCALAAAGCAETPAGVSGPVTGFVFDSQAGAIRAMRGIPGAAYLGSPLVSRVDAASVSPDGSAALAAQAGRLMLYTGLRGAAPVSAAIQGAIAGADRFAWAPDGGAAAVYASKSGQAQILTGLAQSPAAGAPIDLSGIAGSVTALAFDGQRLIVAAASDGAGGIYTASAQSPAQRVASAASPSAIALAGADLYFADNQTQQIWQVRSYAGTPAAVLFSNDSAIATPAGLQLSADGKRLYVANAGSRKLAVYDVASRAAVASLDLAFTPTGLDRFGSASVFLLNGGGHGPLYVLNDSAQPAVYFVPAPAKAQPRKIRIRPL